MLFNTRIKALEGALTAAHEERDALAVDIATLQAANNQFSAADTQLREQLAGVTGERESLALQLAAAQATAAKATATVETKVVEQVASAGVPFVKRDPAAKNEEAKTLTRAELQALPHSARAEHFRNGGKLID